MAAQGIFSLAAFIAGKIAANNREKTGNMLVIVIVALLGIRLYLAFHPLGFTPRLPANDDIGLRLNNANACKDLGQLANLRFGSGRRYFAPWSKIVYYLDGLWTPLPLGSDEELHRYALANEVDYLVIEANSAEEIQSLDKLPAPDGFTAAGILRSARYDYAIGFYRLQKELRK